MNERPAAKVLVVDDNEANRYTTSRYLRQAGFLVVEAATGTEALRLFTEEAPDLVLLDVKLPDVSGRDVCRTIKANPATALTPVIHMSATLTGTDHIVEGLEGGADAYLTAPIEPRELLAQVRAMLRVRQAEQKRRAAEEQQQRERYFLECVIANAGSCMAVVKGWELRYTLVNPAYQAIAPGVPMVGRGFREVFPEAAKAGAEERFLRVLETGEPWIVESYRAPIPGKPDATWQGKVVRLPIVAGEEPSALTVVWDITERMRSEEAFQRSQSRLASAVKIAQLGVWEYDTAAGVTHFDERCREVFGLSEERPLSNDEVFALVHPEDRERVRDQVGCALDPCGTGWYEAEYRVARADHTQRWVAVRGHPVRVDKQIVQFVGTLMDITERKGAEEALRQARDELARINEDLEQKVHERTAQLQEAVGELEHFSYTITHDMRAPLRAMRMFGQILLSESADRLDSTGRDYLQRITTSAQRMDNLITDALQYSWAVRQELHLAPVEPAKLLQGMIHSYPAFQWPKADIRIEGDLPPVLGTEAGLTQCFSNLLNNAVKFVPPDTLPQVRIWPECRDRVVRLWFADNGIGIPRESHARIFGMFERLSTAYEGTGIGLALVRKMTERMGGKVGVESEPGQGSRFWVELRRADAAEAVI